LVLTKGNDTLSLVRPIAVPVSSEDIINLFVENASKIKNELENSNKRLVATQQSEAWLVAVIEETETGQITQATCYGVDYQSKIVLELGNYLNVTTGDSISVEDLDLGNCKRKEHDTN
jgi:hypothetical protein